MGQLVILNFALPRNGLRCREDTCSDPSTQQKVRFIQQSPYDIARLLVCDAWKAQVKGIPAGCFLLAFYDGEDGVEEAVLLGALSQTKLPTDNDVISSMIEYYKDNLDISGRAGSLKRWEIRRIHTL